MLCVFVYMWTAHTVDYLLLLARGKSEWMNGDVCVLD